MKLPSARRGGMGTGVVWGLLLIVVALGLGFYLVSPAGALRIPPFSRRVSGPTLPVAPPVSPDPQKASGTAPAPEGAPTALFAGARQVPVLMYHDITDRQSVYFDVTVDRFAAQLEEFARSGAHPVSLDQLYRHLRFGESLPERAIVLTFDDGYLGQFEKAYPLLKKYQFPATFFVHTAVVGVKTGKDHMTWEQLRSLDKEGLVTVECHTITHPDDLRKCSDSQLDKELRESKARLEKELGKTIRFLAYPVGNADARVARVARAAGYDMAFTMGPGYAASPADAFFVPRFNPKYLPDIMPRLTEDDLVQPFTSTVVDLKTEALESGSEEDGQVRMRWIRGGRLAGLRLLGRRHVPELVRQAGAAAGLNGTFFSDARVNSAGAGIVGPVISRFGPGFAPGLPGDRDRIAGRPMVLVSPEKIAFLPFQPRLALDEEGVQRLLPGATDCFIAGAWLVHDGRALTREEMETFRLENMFDFRPRAFMGVDTEGRPFLGASSTGNQSDRLAETLEQLGLQECVLLDSGFSTSLVLGREVLVSGIRRTNFPARPVPHALVLYPLDPETGKEKLVFDRPDRSLVGPPFVPSIESLQAQMNQAPVVTDDPGTSNAGTPRRRGRRHGKRHRR